MRAISTQIIARTGVGLGLVGLIAAGCGSSGKGASSSTSASAVGHSLSGSPVQIGMISTVSSPGLSQPSVSEAAQAAVLDVNAHGGIHGHPLELKNCNDQFNAQVAAECAQQLLITDKVVALVGTASVIGGGSIYSTLKQANTISFGSYPLNPEDEQSELSYPFVWGGGGNPGVWSLLKPGSGTVVAITYPETQAQVQSAFSPGMSKLGYGLKVLTTPITTTDWSVVAQQAAQLNPKYVVFGLAPASTAAAVTAVAQAGVKAPVALAAGAVGSSSLAPLAASGASVQVAAGYVTDAKSAEYPAYGQYLADLTKYGGQVGRVSDPVAESTFNGWLAVKLFARVANAIPTVTGAQIVAYMDQQPAFQTGATHPLNFAHPSGFPDNARVVNTWAVPAVIQGASLVTTSTNWIYAVP